MSRGPTTFKVRDVKAAVKAMREAGCEVARVKIGKDGTIEVFTGKPDETARENEWDKKT